LAEACETASTGNKPNIIPVMIMVIMTACCMCLKESINISVLSKR